MLPLDRYELRCHEPAPRTGPGRKTTLISAESFGAHQIADLLMRVETLLAHGYQLTIRPPATPPTVDALPAIDPTDCTLTVSAR